MSEKGARFKQIRQSRLKKLKELVRQGTNPYPPDVHHNYPIKQVIIDFDRLVKKKKPLTIAGRITSLREHGRMIFADLTDESGKIQVFLDEKTLHGQFDLAKKTFDVGDIAEFTGLLFKTKKDEKTLRVSDFRFLAKSLRPLPEKWHGLKDEEKRFRRRYLDLLINPKLRRLFKKRSKLINSFRSFLANRKFTEVETPILQPIPGGTEAAPFKTHHNALDIDLFLRIAPELYLKRLIVGGFERIFELGKNFRNEGISTQHLQEFTMLEFYWAYANFDDLLKLNEEMFAQVLEKTFGTLKFDFQGAKLDFTPPWPRSNYAELILEKTDIDITKLPDREGLINEIKSKKLPVEFEPADSYPAILDKLYKTHVRPDLQKVQFLVNHPTAISPLAKKDPSSTSSVLRLQILGAGLELGNGYAELTDPSEQKLRFQEQEKMRAAGDVEAHRMDRDYIEALEYGMPPTVGMGVGMDRLFMVLANLDSVRESVLFPLLRPKSSPSPSQPSQPKSQNEPKEIKMAADQKIDPKITYKDAFDLTHKAIKNDNLFKHALAVEAVLGAMADHLGESDNKEAWRITGILHDLDYEETKDHPEKHTHVTAENLAQIGVDEVIIRAIKTHCDLSGCRPESKLEKVLFATDPLTGLIVATALVNPKKLEGVTAESILKKIPDKSFAAGANREAIKSIEEIGVSLEEFIQIALDAMKAIKDELDL